METMKKIYKIMAEKERRKIVKTVYVHISKIYL